MRIPLIIQNDARDPNRLKDSWGINVFLEQEDGTEGLVVKRPGLRPINSPIGLGQGVFNYHNLAYAVNGDNLQFMISFTSGTQSLIPASIVRVGGSSLLGSNLASVVSTSTDGVTFTTVSANAFDQQLWRHDSTSGLNWTYAFKDRYTLARSSDSWTTYTTVDLSSTVHVPSGGIDLLNGGFMLKDTDQQTLYLFAVTGSTHIRYTSTDNGTTWVSPITITLPVLFDHSFPALSKTSYQAVNFDYAYYAVESAYVLNSIAPRKLYKSTDAFATWTDVTPTNLGTFTQVRALGIVNSLLCIVAANGNVSTVYKLYFSSDGSYWYSDATSYVSKYPDHLGINPATAERVYGLGTKAVLYYSEFLL